MIFNRGDTVMKRYLAVFLALMLIFTVGCSDDGDSQPPLASGSVIITDDVIPDVAPNISGTVTRIASVREGLTLLVEIPDSNKNSAEGKFYVTVTSSTVIEDKDKKTYDDIKKITVGDTVSVWFSGDATNTSPTYAVARGVRIMSHTSDRVLLIKANASTAMASPIESEVSSSDIKPLHYGSYVTASAEGKVLLRFSEVPINFSVSIPTLDTKAESELVADADKVQCMPLECSIEDYSCTVPADLESGEYIAEVRAEYLNETDYYIFLLCVE